MTDAGMKPPLEIEPAAAEVLLAVEIWEEVDAVSADLAGLVGPLPSACRAVSSGAVRVLWWEPLTWLVCAPMRMRDGLAEALSAALSGRGEVTDVSGGLRRIRVQGRGSRELLMIGGVFDAEHGFPVGTTAGTVIHHVPVRLDAVDAGTVDAFVAPSFADELLHHWRKAQARLASRSGSDGDQALGRDAHLPGLPSALTAPVRREIGEAGEAELAEVGEAAGALQDKVPDRPARRRRQAKADAGHGDDDEVAG